MRLLIALFFCASLLSGGIVYAGDGWLYSAVAVAAPTDSDAWLDGGDTDDSPATEPDPDPDPLPPEPVPDYSAAIDDVSDRIDQLQADIIDMRRETADSIAAITQSLQSSTLHLQQAAAAVRQSQAAAPPAQHHHECNCDCPTIDEIRQVVREELERVTVTLKSRETGETKQVDVSVSQPQSPSIVQSLSPGQWYVTAIDGVPVTPRAVQTSSGTAYSYSTPQHEVRTLSSGGRLFGAARSLRSGGVFRSSAGSSCQMVNGVMVCN